MLSELALTDVHRNLQWHRKCNIRDERVDKAKPSLVGQNRKSGEIIRPIVQLTMRTVTRSKLSARYYLSEFERRITLHVSKHFKY